MAIQITHTIRAFDPDTDGCDYDLTPDRAGHLITVTHGGKFAGLIVKLGGGFYSVLVPAVFGVAAPAMNATRVGVAANLEEAVGLLDAHWTKVSTETDEAMA